MEPVDSGHISSLGESMHKQYCRCQKNNGAAFEHCVSATLIHQFGGPFEVQGVLWMVLVMHVIFHLIAVPA